MCDLIPTLRNLSEAKKLLRSHRNFNLWCPIAFFGERKLLKFTKQKVYSIIIFLIRNYALYYFILTNVYYVTAVCPNEAENK